MVPPVSVIVVEMPKEPARIAHHAARAFETDRDAVGLERGQQHREIAGVLVDRLAALLAFFLELLERRRHRRHQLDDDRGRDVRHDVEREDRHPVDAAAGEHVEHAENAAGLGAEDLFPGGRVDAGQRNVGAEPINEQRTQREPDALLQFLGLGERAEVEVCRQLFRCRDHGPSLRE
jgi:hypothetical protein